ncbi:MAG: two-component system chemotaxis sensor kinase CheA [Enterobacterales bacterium]|jgi:two-component system chemotaxis sensor kinase CheA
MKELDFDSIKERFFEEAQELLIEMENVLLAIEDKPNDSEMINSLFRAMHTIKGSSGMFGFNVIVAFTHEAETILDQVRNGEKYLDDTLISVLLGCKDHTVSLLEHCLTASEEELSDQLKSIGNELIIQLTGKIDLEGSYDLSATENVLVNLNDGVDLTDCWLISLVFKVDTFRVGISPLSFIIYMKTIGEIQAILLLTPEMPESEEFNPESCYLEYKIAYKTDIDKQEIEDIFEFASDCCEINILPPNSKIEKYIALLGELAEDHVPLLGEMLLEIGVLTEADVSKAIQRQYGLEGGEKPLGEILVEQQVVQHGLVDKALQKQEQVKKKMATESSYIRVDSAKLGHLINLVGELVISGAALNLMVERHGLPDVEDVAETMNSLVSDIRDTALDLRMVPIGETFSRFKRVVRDVSKELNKDILLTITGGETELDKTVVEKINDPLTHLIRNSLDHGIETPEQRLASGKETKGNIHLNAYHESGLIIIQIIDDGAGLNAEKILTKAINNGLIPEDHNLTEQETYNLIFSAGLSTKAQATDLSGRGVGMDVVKRNIEGLRGSVNISSVPGQGTTITIQLPLTLAIIDGFMVEASNERYIIPLSMVEECVELNSKEWEVNDVSHYVNLRGEPMPYLRLGDYFSETECINKEKRESLVVVRFGQSKAGFVVDELHGEHQTVIKPLGKVFEKLAGLTGATVLGDGNIALILDVQGLIKRATRKI